MKTEVTISGILAKADELRRKIKDHEDAIGELQIGIKAIDHVVAMYNRGEFGNVPTEKPQPEAKNEQPAPPAPPAPSTSPQGEAKEPRAQVEKEPKRRHGGVMHGQCIVDGCERASTAKGMCAKHYRKEWMKKQLAKQQVHPLVEGTAEAKKECWRTDVPDEKWEGGQEERFHRVLSKAAGKPTDSWKESAALADAPTAEIPPVNSPTWKRTCKSTCCDAPVFAGEKHSHGLYYCGKCGKGCLWKSGQPLAISWSCRVDGCKSIVPAADGYCWKHYQERGKKPSQQETDVLSEIASPSEDDDGK